MRFGSQAWLSSHLFPVEQLGRADLLTQPGPQCTKDGWGQVGEARMNKEGQQGDCVPNSFPLFYAGQGENKWQTFPKPPP